MKRDMDLSRHILQDIEKVPAGHTINQITPYPGFSAQEYIGHVDLLLDAGFLKGRVECYVTQRLQIDRITWQGLDFLQAMRDDTIWKKAKSHVIKETGSWTFSLLLEYLKMEARQKIGLQLP